MLVNVRHVAYLIMVLHTVGTTFKSFNSNRINECSRQEEHWISTLIFACKILFKMQPTSPPQGLHTGIFNFSLRILFDHFICYISCHCALFAQEGTDSIYLRMTPVVTMLQVMMVPCNKYQKGIPGSICAQYRSQHRVRATTL